MKISVTLVIPVYNVEKYLVQCLNSVVDQSTPFDEVILINDGSTDNSLAICRKYVAKYGYFKLINQENQGLSEVRNLGIKYAFGEYIMFLDSDDYLRPDTVKVLKEQLREFSYDAIFFDADITYENEVYFANNIYDRTGAGLDGKTWSGWEYFIKCYPQKYVISSCMAIYKRKTIISKNIRFPEKIYFEDNYFTLMFVCQAGCVAHISEKLYQRRYRENSITTSVYSERKFIDYIKCFLFIVDGVCQIDQSILMKLKEKLLEFISDWCNSIFSNYKKYEKQDVVLGENAIFLFKHMQEKYLWLLDELSFNASCLDLPVLNTMLKNFSYMKYYGLKNRQSVEKKISEVIDVEKNFYLHILKDLPLNKDCKIGIYGTGKHTEGLINIYEKLVGRITCDLVFLDSQKNNGWYKNRKIINYQKIDEEKFDLIIISSFLYEKQMLRNIEGINQNISIYTFYHTIKWDAFSGYEVFYNFFDSQQILSLQKNWN